MQVPVIDLRRSLGMITWLSVTLVVVSALVVGAIVHLVVPEVSFAAGVALGAVVSPTDAVAATAIGKRLGLPHRLMTVLEGESLFNDASALVVLRTALLAITAGFSLGDAVLDFVRAVALAVVIGYAVGRATVWLRSKLADPVLMTAVSFIVPFLAFLPAEEAEASGVVAVVVAGLVTGHHGARRFTARERLTERTNWLTLQFLVENGVFLLDGPAARGPAPRPRRVQQHGAPGARGVRARPRRAPGPADRRSSPSRSWPRAASSRSSTRCASACRRSATGSTRCPRRAAGGSTEIGAGDGCRSSAAASSAAGPTSTTRRASPSRRAVARSCRGPACAAWSTLAAALTIGTEVDERTLLITVAFVVAVASLLLYGGTLPLLIRALGVSGVDPLEQRDEVAELFGGISATATAALGPTDRVVIDGQAIDPGVAEETLGWLDRVREQRSDTTPEALSLASQRMLLHRELISLMRDALHEEQAIGAYSTGALARASALIDAQELRLER